MKLSYNNKEIFELSETQKKVIQNDIPQEIFESDMTRRCKYWLEVPAHKHVHRERKNMEKKLKDKGRAQIPLKEDAFMNMVADEFPCKCGYKDIERDAPCKVGNQTFNFSAPYRKMFRKMHEERQEHMSEEEYIKEETEELEKRMAWILQHKYERCLERLKLEWYPKLEARGVESIPSDEEEFCNLVFSQPDYKNRSERDKESE